MKKKAVKTAGILLLVAIVICGAFWAKNYYNNRYVASDCFYTQIPLDEVNEDSWLLDSDGAQQEKGKKYVLIGYNEAGEQKEVSFVKKGAAEDYYAPGAYIKVTASRTIEIGVQAVEEGDVPKTALEKIALQGTKIKV